MFQRGIHGICQVRDKDEVDRRPAIIISSSPHKAGSVQTPWQDEYTPDYGYVRYYGDNKSSKSSPEASPGNKILLAAFRLHSSPNKIDRLRSTPIVFFNRITYEGRLKGNVVFQGFGIIESVELITQYSASGNYFSNYAFNMCVFSLKSEGENFDWTWINSRRNPDINLMETMKKAPKS